MKSWQKNVIVVLVCSCLFVSPIFRLLLMSLSVSAISLSFIGGFGGIISFYIPIYLAQGNSYASITHMMTYPTLSMSVIAFYKKMDADNQKGYWQPRRYAHCDSWRAQSCYARCDNRPDDWCFSLRYFELTRDAYVRKNAHWTCRRTERVSSTADCTSKKAESYLAMTDCGRKFTSCTNGHKR